MAAHLVSHPASQTKARSFATHADARPWRAGRRSLKIVLRHPSYRTDTDTPMHVHHHLMYYSPAMVRFHRCCIRTCTLPRHFLSDSYSNGVLDVFGDRILQRMAFQSTYSRSFLPRSSATQSRVWGAERPAQASSCIIDHDRYDP